MKLNQLLIVKVYRKKEPTEYKLDNGRTGLSYRIIVDDYETTTELKVSEDCYNILEAGKDYILTTVFDTEAVRKETKVTGMLFALPCEKFKNVDLKGCLEYSFNNVNSPFYIPSVASVANVNDVLLSPDNSSDNDTASTAEKSSKKSGRK